MINQQWPLYVDSSGNYVNAVPIKTIKTANDGSAIATFDGGYQERYMSAMFFATFKPVVGGYLFRSQYGELLYLSKAAFEAKYTASGPTITAATTTVIGGVKKGAAVANSAATDVAGVNTVLNALLASLRAAGTIST